MTTREERRRTLARAMAGWVMLSLVSHAIPARAGGGPDPVVLADKSALPRDCVSLGDVSGKHADESPRPEKAQEYAIHEAKAKGATHVVTDSAHRCGGSSYCYEGVAYRCPAPVGPSSGK